MDNKDKILACARKLFYQKGYDAVGIQEICQEAGITKPTMYHYFGSKYGLLESVLEEDFVTFLKEASEVCRTENGIQKEMDDLARVMFDFAHEKPEAYMLLMALSYSAKDNEVYQAVKPYITRLYDLTVQMFENASDQLGNMNGRQAQFAIGFLGIINHYIMFLGYKEETDSIAVVSDENRSSLIHQFMHGIWT